jgi:hypothetical protein
MRHLGFLVPSRVVIYKYHIVTMFLISYICYYSVTIFMFVGIYLLQCAIFHVLLFVSGFASGSVKGLGPHKSQS